jgi:AcrR family transcriptional regulator
MSTTQQQIAEVFARHVDRFGYAKTTLDEVAREMHISKKTIYVHFDGKREIYEYVVDRQAAQEKLRMKALVSQLPTCNERVETLVRFVIAAARAHIAETSEAEWMQELEIAGDAFKKAHGDLLREFTAEGMATGEFAQGDPELVERMVAAMLIEYLIIVNARPGYDRDDELVRRILSFIG